MEKFYLETPTIKRKAEALDYLNEHIKYHSDMNGTGSMDRCLNEWTYEQSPTTENNNKKSEKESKTQKNTSKTEETA